MSAALKFPLPPLPRLPARDHIPPELLDLKQWISWRAEWDESKQKYKKPPASPVTGEPIGAVEKHRHHFSTFDEAVRGTKDHSLTGVGFVFTNDSPYLGIDFDNCVVNGVINPKVTVWLRWFVGAYVEISPSGEGVHIICRGAIAKAVAAKPLPDAPEVTVEMYADSRFFTWTGQRVDPQLDGHQIDSPSMEISDCQDGIKRLLTYINADSDSASSAAPNSERPASRRQLLDLHGKALEKLRAAAQGIGNATLNATALTVARIFLAGVLEKTEEQAQDELYQIVTREWKSPHPQAGARSTINSGWNKGVELGPFKLRPYVMAIESTAYCAEAPKESPYVVDGIIYQGTANQLMGPIKDGKTTFLFAMIRNVLAGTDFIGLKTKSTNILYVTEQPRQSFQSQLTRSGLDRNLLLEERQKRMYVLDLGQLWDLNWEGRVDSIRENADKLDAGLVIVDTFPRIALVEEIQNAGEMNQRFERIAPVVNADGRTLLMCWHERKAGGSISEAAAGSVASGGAVDTLIRLRRAQGAKLNDRTRQLELCGRLPVAFEETVAIILNIEMSDYKCLGSKQAAVKKSVEQQILSLLPMKPPGLTRKDIDEQLSGDAAEQDLEAPARSTVTRALEALMEGGYIARTGAGGQGGRSSSSDSDPYRYHGVQNF